ncbi:uncharacterized protein LAJ45_08311 [Morchella importuna]|uniref:uncharacterized protein n=1 Tax=Morchella importuna TaxID=1174673 RepID=UPI001E8CB4C5|nr:uncharacterized protein LAJ45_08311 [Morchella importuna]KAH8147484.1 hypothetical protein LAJ45_08311 [Morchella importuna]
MSSSEGLIASLYNASVRTPETPSRVPEDISSKSHHAKCRKGFQNPWPSWKDIQPMDGIKYFTSTRLDKNYCGGYHGKAIEDTVPPVVAPQFPKSRSTKSKEFRATWLGHACFYVEFPGGLRALFDPVFSQRCSPVQFMGPKRVTKMPCDIKDIPAIDIVAISHNHYDHMDYNTIMELKKCHPNVWFFVPLGNKSWFTSSGIPNCTEMDWWEERDLVLSPADSESAAKLSESSSPEGTDSPLKVTTSGPAEEGKKAGEITARIGCLPCQHTSNRGLHDRSSTLWSSWSVESGGKKLYFAGDTGYRAVPKVPDGVDDYGEEFKDLPVCPAFKQVGELRGGFDLGLIPIGAYWPRWFMSPMHASPYDSVRIFVETKCKKAIGMHWGTWVLTDEPVMEPPVVLKEALKKDGIAEEGVFDVLDIGESREY